MNVAPKEVNNNFKESIVKYEWTLEIILSTILLQIRYRIIQGLTFNKTHRNMLNNGI